MNRTRKNIVLISTVSVAAILFSLCAPGFSQTKPAATQSADSSPADNQTPPPEKITLLQSAILGVVEGITEYLPVSSTGHLILTDYAMGHSQFTDEPGPFGRTIKKTPAIDAFEIVIQLGAILAVIGLYRAQVWRMLLGLCGKDRGGLKLFLLLVVAVVPAAVVGLAFRKTIKEYLFAPGPVCWALAVGGILMIAVEQFCHRRRRGGKRENLTIGRMCFRHALIIGLAQCLALWPGTSRSMVTILAGMLVGLDIASSAKFSFLLALPTLGGATLYEGVTGWDQIISCAGAGGLIVGLVVSGIVAAVAVKLFVKWLTRGGLTPFGVYRIILAIVVWLVIMA